MQNISPLLFRFLLLSTKIHKNQIALAKQMNSLNEEQEKALEESREMLKELFCKMARIKETKPMIAPIEFFEL